MKTGMKITLHRFAGEPSEGTQDVYVFFSALQAVYYDDEYRFVALHLKSEIKLTTPLSLEEVIELIEQ